MSAVESKTEVFTITDPEMADPPAGRRKSFTVFEGYVQPWFAELFGTTLFVFVGCSSVVSNVASGVVQPAVAHGLALAVLIMLFGQISGGHFNPAVSLSVYLCGGMELRLLVPYVVAQMCGGMMGAGLVKALYPPGLYGIGGAFNANDLGKATLAEAVMTMFLTTAVCMGAINSQTRTQSAPFCIGLTVTANIFAGWLVSGACMNPARAFGPAVVANHWTNHWVYWVGPICGALLTVITVRLLFGDQKTRILLK